jgi:hypothetical protein
MLPSEFSSEGLNPALSALKSSRPSVFKKASAIWLRVLLWTHTQRGLLIFFFLQVFKQATFIQKRTF